MIFDNRGIFGFDISTYQDAPAIPGNVDFAKMRSFGASFVIIKAGQGDWADPDFATNWRNAKGVLPRASYYYYDNRYDPKVQARKYSDLLQPDPEGIRWLDLEDRTVAAFAGWRRWYDFLEESKTFNPSEQFGIYTGFYYFIEFLKYATTAQLEYFKQYPLWLASYPPDPFRPDYQNILVPPPWTSPLILQSGTPAIGLEAGVESREIDYNQFNGDAVRFATVFGGPVPVPTEPTEEPMPNYFKVTAGQLNLRAAGAATAVDIGDVYANDVLQCGELVNGWRQVFAIWRNNAPVALPAPVVWAHGAYMVATTFVPPAPAAVYPVSAEVTMSDGSKWTGSFTRA